MKSGYENKSLLLNADLANKKKGAIINIKVDKEGTPVDPYWRNRVKDSKMDNCVEFVDSEAISGDGKEVVKKAAQKKASKKSSNKT